MSIETNLNLDAEPSRSLLHSLRPLGVGTPFVESAESYLRRLAVSHAVEHSQLHRFINDAGEPIYGDLKGQTARVDALTHNAAAFMRRTAQLTRQPVVALLGLGWLAGHVTGQQSLRKRHAWCTACFAEMRAEGQDVHLPMLWSFAQLDCCPRHGMPWTEACPQCCRRSLVTRGRTGQVGACGSCGESLTEGPLPVSNMERSATPARSLAVADQFGRLLLAAQDLAGDFRRPSFAQVILSLSRRGLMVSPGELGLRMGVSKGTVSDLLKGRGEAGLDMLLRLATALAVPLPDLILSPITLQCDARNHNVGHGPIAWAPRAKPRKDWVQLQMALELESTSSTPVSLPALARRVGVDVKHLSATLPAETSALRIQRRVAASVAQQLGVNDIVRRLIAVGAPSCVSKRGAARAIGVGRTRKCFQDAWTR
ncbi:MAG TPA: TniQ family protein [Burkholderiaceae bacterium]|jgi:hypothetical protein